MSRSKSGGVRISFFLCCDLKNQKSNLKTTSQKLVSESSSASPLTRGTIHWGTIQCSFARTTSSSCVKGGAEADLIALKHKMVK